MRYARALAERGDEVDVIALNHGGEHPAFEVMDGVNVHRIQRRERNEKGKFSYLYRLVKFCLKSSVCLSRLHLKRKYDLVHVHNVPDFLVFSALLPKLTGAKIILDIHDLLPEFFADKFRRSEDSVYVSVLKFIELISTRFADHVIISNHLWHSKVTLRSVPLDRCSVFINNVEQEVFSCRRTRNDARFIMLYHGGLQRHQGLDIAISAFARVRGRMPGAEFHIYGGGNVKPDLLALVERLQMKEKVLFFDAMPMRKIAAVVANADLGVVPKRADSFGNEAFSTKIMEYMSAGVPALISNTRVDAYYYNDSIVRFFESGNEEQLGEAMVSLMKNPGTRAELARNATEYVAQNNWNTRKHDYLRLVDSLIHSRESKTVPVAQKTSPLQ